MKSKLWYLTGVSLKRKVCTKWFLIANVILLVSMFALFNIDRIIKFFGGDFDEKTKVYVIDETKKSYDFFEAILTETSAAIQGGESSFLPSIYDKSLEEAKEEMKQNAKIVTIIFSYDEKNMLKASLISKGTIDTIPYQVLTNSIQNTKVNLALMDSGLDPSFMQEVNRPIEIAREILDENKKGEEESAQMIMSTIFPFFILPFFMLTMFLVQMIGAEVNDEKMTRGMEIIISNVSPKTHFFSKVLAGISFVLIQGGLLIFFVLFTYLIKRFFIGTGSDSGVEAFVTTTIHDILNSGIGKELIFILPFTGILMLFTFVGYALLAGILASMTTNTEDFQQLQSPIMVVSMAGYFLSIMASMFQGSIFLRICSYIPFISAILSPSLLVLGHIGPFDIFLSCIFMILINYLLIKYGLRIYKVGILNYSSKNLWKKMFQAARSK